jgi:hypothetical protein
MKREWLRRERVEQFALATPIGRHHLAAQARRYTLEAQGFLSLRGCGPGTSPTRRHRRPSPMRLLDVPKERGDYGCVAIVRITNSQRPRCS